MEWIATNWQEILDSFSKLGSFDFDIFPLLENPLFIMICLSVALFLLLTKSYRLLILGVALLALGLSWSFFISKYGTLKAVPMENWVLLFIIGLIFLIVLVFVAIRPGE
jgi:uncharacterized membrane protein YfhO